MEIEFRTLPDMRLAAVRHIGPFWKIGETFAKVGDWAKSKGIPFEGNLVAIYWDDPGTTPESELKSDACAIVPESMSLAGEPVQETRLQGGTYAVGTHIGSYANMGQSWGAFMEALGKSGRQPCGPGIEIYLDDCDVTPVDRLRTELAIPVTGGV